MHPAVGTRAERPVAQNIDTILRLEKQDEAKLAVHHRLFHWLAGSSALSGLSSFSAYSYSPESFSITSFRITPLTNIRSRCLRRS